jgi:SAM-dependent methyltransferase
MSKMQDPVYLREDQYRTPDNLNARIRLHVGFSTNAYGWFRWVFDQYDLPENCRILELACGPGDLWRENAERVPPGWEVVLSDFSPGMVTRARENLAGAAHPFTFEIIDAQSIPYGAGSFDVVIANHCLYHFPDRIKALVEIHRVLESGGRFYATTIGATHLAEIDKLVARFVPDLVHVFNNEDIPFTLENGGAQLTPCFADVSIHRYRDSLQVTQVDPLVDYILSGTRFGMSEDRREALTTFVRSEISASGGVFHIHKDSGLFAAHKLDVS